MLPEGKGSKNSAIALVQYSIGSGGGGAENTPRRNIPQRPEISAKPNWPLGFPYQVLIKAI